MKIFRNKKRDRLRKQPFPADWDEILRENFSLYLRLTGADRRELQGHIHVFLAEKQFEGCNDLEITEEIRVTVAAQACLLLLHRDTDYFPAMTSIFVYPTLFYADVAEADEYGIVSEYEEDRAGESWDYGPVVLSWEDALMGASEAEKGYNFRGFPILDDESKIVGILTSKDIRFSRSKRAPVADIMTTKVSCVRPDQSVDECMALMTARAVRHLPVLEDGRLIGVVSIGDMVNSIIHDQQFLIEELEHFIHGR